VIAKRLETGPKHSRCINLGGPWRDALAELPAWLSVPGEAESLGFKRYRGLHRKALRSRAGYLLLILFFDLLALELEFEYDRAERKSTPSGRPSSSADTELWRASRKNR
jgi:hypothetical protein